MGSSTPTLAERLFIVPDAHLRVDALDFQLEMYELFHRTTVGRLGHVLGTPTVILGASIAAHAIHPSIGGAFAGAVAIGMAVNGWRLDRATAFVGALVVVALSIAGGALSGLLGGSALGSGVALALGGCAIQTLSHLAEDVPPPQSEREGFVPVLQWIRIVGVRGIARSVVQTVCVFFWLELWASLRILPLQLLQLAMGLGHRPELRRSLDLRIAAIVGGRDPSWRLAGDASAPAAPAIAVPVGETGRPG